MEEYEVEIGDFETTRVILTTLGMTEFAKDFRRRKSYRLPNGVVEINLYDDIPAFLEIETDSKDKLKSIVEQLGFTMADTKPWNGKDVLRHYGKIS